MKSLLPALFCLAGLSRGLSPLEAAAGDRPPNLVLLFADDLGYGDLGCYGHPTIRTPHLDAMAAAGVRLTSFYAAPVCSPSRAALLTGRYPPRSGIYRVIGPDDGGGIPASEVTLAEGVKARGYLTAAIGKWHLGHFRRKFLPTENGFDEYFGLLYSNDMMPPWVETKRPLQLYSGVEPVEHPVEQSTLTSRYTERAVDFIRRSKAGPFFLYVAYSMPHVPISASPAFAGRSAAGPYGDVIEEIDGSVGRIRQTLREEELEGNTLVLFTSDNGPWLDLPPRMFREGRIQSWHVGSPGPLRGSKGSTYEGGVRVPCIAAWPGSLPAGRVTAGLASEMDVYVTFLRLAGAQVPSDRPIDGVDIFALLMGDGGLAGAGGSAAGQPSPRRELGYFAGKALEAIREDRWKLRWTRRRSKDPEIELYDLERDPSERYNVAASHPDIVRRLQDRLEKLASEVHAGRALDAFRRF